MVDENRRENLRVEFPEDDLFDLLSEGVELALEVGLALLQADLLYLGLAGVDVEVLELNAGSSLALGEGSRQEEFLSEQISKREFQGLADEHFRLRL